MSYLQCMDPTGIKLLTRLPVNLREHKFRHNFLETLNPLCNCSLEIESTSHYILRCPFYKHIYEEHSLTILLILGFSTVRY